MIKRHLAKKHKGRRERAFPVLGKCRRFSSRGERKKKKLGRPAAQRRAPRLKVLRAGNSEDGQRAGVF